MSTVIVILFFGFILWNIVRDRITDYYQYHQALAQSATKKVAVEVTEILARKQKLVTNFIEDNVALMNKVVKDLDDLDTYDALDIKLKRYFSDYSSSSIANKKGEPLKTDFGEVGALCITDLKSFLHTNAYKVRIHPSPTLFHYDIFVKFKYQAQELLFIATFSSEEIATLLNASSSVYHNLMLIIKEKSHLIEVSKFGSRNVLKNRKTITLSSSEKSRILASEKIENSYWHIIDFYDTALLTSYKHTLIKGSLTIFILFVLLMLYISFVLLRAIRRKETLQLQLEEKNSKIKSLNENLKKLSLTDSLTSLYNRRYFDKQLDRRCKEALRLGKPLSIAMLDIDYFKNYNDLYGHQKGDECLLAVAQLCQENFRRANEFCARYGGEEFAIVNFGDDAKSFFKRLEELQKKIALKAFKHEGSMIADTLTLSIGLVTSDGKKVCESEELIKKADRALYKAKEEGRNQIVVSNDGIDLE